MGQDRMKKLYHPVFCESKGTSIPLEECLDEYVEGNCGKNDKAEIRHRCHHCPVGENRRRDFAGVREVL